MVGNTFEEWNKYYFVGSFYEKMPNNSDNLHELDAGTVNPQTGGTFTTSILSYLGRLTYNYNDKYYLTATYRVDGSSKFLSKNKMGFFPFSFYSLAYV